MEFFNSPLSRGEEVSENLLFWGHGESLFHLVPLAALGYGEGVATDLRYHTGELHGDQLVEPLAHQFCQRLELSAVQVLDGIDQAGRQFPADIGLLLNALLSLRAG